MTTQHPAPAAMTEAELETCIGNVLEVIYQTEVLKSFTRVAAAARAGVDPTKVLVPLPLVEKLVNILDGQSLQESPATLRDQLRDLIKRSRK